MVSVLAMPAPPAAAAAPDEWGQRAGHATGDRFNPGETRLTPATVGRLAPGWSVPLAEATCADPSEPLVGARNLVVAASYRISAFDAGSGTLRWRTADAGRRDIRLVAVGGGEVLAQFLDCRSRKAFLTALDERTGKVRWTRAITDLMYAPLVRDGVLVGGLWDPALGGYGMRAYRIKDGALLWARAGSVRGDVMSSVVVTGDAALDVVTGKPVWRLDAGCNTPIGASPDGGRFSMHCGDSRGIRVLRASDGRVEATFPSYGPVTGFATDGRRVYTQAGDSVLALDARDGRHLWSANYAGDPPLTFAVAGGVLYGWRGNGKAVAALASATGRPIKLSPKTAALSGENLMVAHGRLFGTTAHGVSTFR